MAERLWECQRVRAGPLVKELRMIRPRFSRFDDADERAEKKFIRRYCAVTRRSVDRLELRLALMGWDSAHYTLEFDPATLPQTYTGALICFQTFLRRCKRRREKEGKAPGFGFVKRIEGLHSRYHVHFVCDRADFSCAELQELWSFGGVFEEDVIRDCTGFRRLARYFLKERLDGVVFPLDKQPLSWSASLRLPEIEIFHSASPKIELPNGAIALHLPSVYSNQFGGFCYGSYLIPDKSRACARARGYLKRVPYSRTKGTNGGNAIDGRK